MRNQELAGKISAYEAFTHHLEGDFDFDRTFGANSVALAGTVIDMNYPNVHEIFGSTSPATFAAFIHENLRDIDCKTESRGRRQSGQPHNRLLWRPDRLAAVAC